MAQDLASRILTEHAATLTALPDTGSAAHRRRVLERLTALGVPSAREENWKYANLRPLERVRFTPAPARTPPNDICAQLPQPLAGYVRHVFIDGRHAAELSAPASVPAGVRLQPLAVDATAGGSLESSSGDRRFALLNEAFAPAGMAVSLEANATACLELVFVASTAAESAASYPRIAVSVAPGAQLTLVEQHLSLGSDASFVNAAIAIEIASGGSLRHCRLQQLGTRALWLDTLAVTLQSHASYQLHGIALGSGSARSSLEARILGSRAQVALSLASVAGGHQTHDVLARVEHVAPEARTKQVFRGIAAQRARVACNGKIVVGAQARGTDSRQSLRGLLAGAEAEIDVRPQLEIYTDEVRCSHGATTGKLDETMLFYLLSRGIAPEIAQQLLKWAFLEDVIASIPVPELRRRIEASLAGRMSESQALQELL